jgi:NTE family protein
MKVGLVLGAGGVVGASWLIGALDALESETGWRASSADHIIGTSAGSAVGAVVASGVEAPFMAAYAAGRTLEGLVEAEERAEGVVTRITGSELRLQRALPPLGPGSWRLAASTLLRPQRHAPAAVLAGWLPRGFVSTAPVRALVERFVPGPWPDHPAYWAVAADYGSGKRVPFGRHDAPPARVADAVAASCAIPGWYHPVKIDGRRYVDGGICSASNLDLLRGTDVDLVVCLNPMSTLAQAAGGSAADRFAALMRAQTGRRLGHEARKLRQEGKHLIVLQPTEHDLALMGLNLMDGRRRVAVLEQARKSTALTLRHMREERAMLPGRSRTRRASAAPAAAAAGRAA